MENKIRSIALYLPQYHPIPENDKWWGTGFTEWTNVGSARPLFRGHYQPRVPADLGYYDLRLPEVRKAQADMAREYGIEGFGYWHYWFGNGKMLLEQPFKEVLQSGEPDFPFCLAWANHSWKDKSWSNDGKDKMLIEQLYPGEEDYIAHFNYLLPAFRDHRYMTVDGKPIFMIFEPLGSPEIVVFMETWRKLAAENGLPGFYFIGYSQRLKHKEKILSLGFDAVNNISLLTVQARQNPITRAVQKLKVNLLKRPRVYSYRKAMRYFSCEADRELTVIPSVFPNWDHTPRSGSKGIVIHNSSPALFKKHVKQVFERIKHKPYQKRIVIIKSWNEWGEGNYIEPDRRYGKGYLRAYKEALHETQVK